MTDTKNWTEVRRWEESFSPSEWADYHTTGLTHVLDPWWDKDCMWDPPLPTFSDAEISAWVADREAGIIETIDVPEPDDLNPNSWHDLFYLAIARTLGWDAAEAAGPGLWGMEEEGPP